LQKIFGIIGKNDYVVTYNGTDYDLRVLKLRASKLLTEEVPVND
jgi:predicted PolB exonuclease-like 3'-5' exonuclease